MEKLKSMIPLKLKKMIEESNPDDLHSTSSSLHDFFTQLPLFHTMLEDLTNPHLGLCAKNKNAALELKNKGNACFSAGDYSQALHFYSQALRVAPLDAVDKDNLLVATLYVNRASSLHKLSRSEESLRDCNRALTIDPRYAKAWYRRGKVNTSLLNYEDATYDLKIAISMERTSSGKRQIESDLKSIVNQTKNGRSNIRGKNQLVIDEVLQANLQCVSTPTKGRGMTSQVDIPSASLVHREEPYAAVILKDFRETHCHFCFNELPADTLPCTSCSIPLYCSDHCQRQAGGQVSRKCLLKNETAAVLSGELERYFSEVTLEDESDSGFECFTEHGHECHGVNWPAVLPSDVVLAGRILMKLMNVKEYSGDMENSFKNLDLSHDYAQVPLQSKLELHVYSIVLLHCIHYSFPSKLEPNAATIAKVIILISQIKVNSMAIVRMRCLDTYHLLDQSGELSSHGDNFTSNLEQVRVGQAIYLTGSLFNHSCLPNIHSYFVSRTLLIRATEFVPAGCPLELSYGPQVGQWDYRQRQEFLRDKYSFKCQCVGCTRANLPDLVLGAYRCEKPDCLGVILDECTFEYEMHKIRCLQDITDVHILEPQRKVDELNGDKIKKFAHLVFEQSNYTREIKFGCCLNCCSAFDVKLLHGTVDKAVVCIKSLQEAVNSNKIHTGLISKALNSLEVLKVALHPYNKKLAEAEDIIAEALCSVGEMQRAMNHCLASIKILEEIYNPGHIVLGNELLKLSSIQLSLLEPAVVETVNQMDAIFFKYYGRHVEVMFPYLQYLKREVHRIADGRSSIHES